MPTSDYTPTEGCVCVATVTPRTISTAAEVHVTRVLTSVEQLDALPGGSVVVDADGDAYQKEREGDRWHMVGIAPSQRSSSIFADADSMGPATLLVPATATPEPVCICGTPGLDYDGPDEECPIHGRTLEAIARALNTTVSAFLSPDERAEASRMLVGVSVATAAPEPVRLTADDPRWKDGAKVRGEYDRDGSAVEGWLFTSTSLPGRWFIRHTERDRNVEVPGRILSGRVYLLAEAPDPDAELVAKVDDALSELDAGYVGDRGAALVAALRQRNVIKRADS